MLTLHQAAQLAAKKYNKHPTQGALSAACRSGKLPSKKVFVAGTAVLLRMVEEADLARYLETFVPGRGASKGNKRRVGTRQSTDARQKISESLREAHAKKLLEENNV